MQTGQNFTELQKEYNAYAQRTIEAYRSDKCSLKQKIIKKPFMALIKGFYMEHKAIKETCQEITLRVLQLLQSYYNDCEVSEQDISDVNKMMRNATKKEIKYTLIDSSDSDFGLMEDETDRDVKTGKVLNPNKPIETDPEEKDD